MTRILAAILGVCVLAPTSLFGAGLPKELREAIDGQVKPLLDSESVVGLVVAIRRGDEEAFLPYGKIALGKPETPNADAVYEIGSMSKTFTGILLADMALRKVVDLDQPAQDLLRAQWKMPIHGDKPITLADLATHTSGFPRMPANIKLADPANPYADYTRKLLLAGLAECPLSRDPGTYEYSNYGMGLLGELLAIRARKSYADLIEERICKPLGMKDTSIALTPDMKKRLAPPYSAGRQPAKNWDFGALAGCGGVRSTPRDMLRYATAMTAPDDSELGKAMRLAAERRHDIPRGGIGLAWHIAGDGVTLWHNGGTGGYSSAMFCAGPQKVSVVVLANTYCPEITPLAEKIAQTALGMKVEPVAFAKAAAVPADVLKRYVGKYAIIPTFVMDVTEENGQLFVQATGQPKFPIFATSEKEFFLKVVDAQIKFVVDDKGKVEKLILHQNGVDQDAKRLPD